MRWLKIVMTWLLQIVVGLLLVFVGSGKFWDPNWALRFAHWGYPPGFHLVVGGVEVVAGLAVLVPPLASYGGILTMVVMTGAEATHLVHGERHRLLPPLVFLLLAAAIAWLRRTSARRRRPAGVPQAPDEMMPRR